MREGAKDQVDGGIEEGGTGPRKKWMKKGRLRAALLVLWYLERVGLSGYGWHDL